MATILKTKPPTWILTLMIGRLTALEKLIILCVVPITIM
jgi:hypothetical protein